MDTPKIVKQSNVQEVFRIVKKILVYFPALILAVLFTYTLTKTKFDLRGTDGKTSAYYIIGMIIMLCVTIIVPIIGRKKIPAVIGSVFYVLVPFASFLLLELYTHNPFDINNDILMLNVLFFYILCFALTVLTTFSGIATGITSGLPFLFGLANYLTLTFRGTPIFPWDFLSLGTAVSVLDNYTVEPTLQLCFIIFTFLFMIYFGAVSGFRFKLKKLWIQGIVAAIALGVTVGYCAYLQTDDCESKYGLYPYLFSPVYLYKYNGTAVSLISNMKFMKIEKPSGYSTSELEEMYDNYNELALKTKETQTKKPNIIVIMNEAFSDPAILGEFTTNKEYMPFINSLTENTVKGNLYVSVKGGNTANTEFEFLTGTSMAYLPNGSIPYQQYISRNTANLTTQLKALGYQTVGMHPYYASGWERDKVYGCFGFDKALFISDFTSTQRIRGYVSDKSSYQKIIQLYQQKEEAKPLFVFEVTMQNHGSYSKEYANFTPDVTVDGTNSYILSAYMSLIKKSDEAFQYLVNYFSGVEEPTIILMFGDHQPNDNVIQPILNMNGINMNTASLEVQQTRYVTPYIIWANYDIEEGEGPATSANYLSTLLFETAGIELSPYQCYLKELSAKYPVMNANCFVNADGVFYSVKDIYSVKELNTYAKFLYNLIFDGKNTVNEFFAPAKG